MQEFCQAIQSSEFLLFFFVASTALAAAAFVYGLVFEKVFDSNVRKKLKVPIYLIVGAFPLVVFWVVMGFCGSVLEHFSISYVVRRFIFLPPPGCYTLAFLISLIGLALPLRFVRIHRFLLLSLLPILGFGNLLFYAVGRG